MGASRQKLASQFAADLLAAACKAQPQAQAAAFTWPEGSEEVGMAHQSEQVGMNSLRFGSIPQSGGPFPDTVSPASMGNYSRVDTQGLAEKNALVLLPDRVEVYELDFTVKPSLWRGKVIPKLGKHLATWDRRQLRFEASEPFGRAPDGQSVRRLTIANKANGTVYRQRISASTEDEAFLAALDAF